MPAYTINIPAAATGNVANTFAGIVGIKMADTAGHQFRVSNITVGGGGGAPQDEQVTLQIRRTDNTADGTSTAVNVNTIGKKNPLSIASNVAAIGETYTVEATNKGTEIIGLGAFNARGSLVRDWSNDLGNAPEFLRNTTMILEGAPGQAVAVLLSVSIEWEEF